MKRGELTSLIGQAEPGKPGLVSRAKGGAANPASAALRAEYTETCSLSSKEARRSNLDDPHFHLYGSEHLHRSNPGVRSYAEGGLCLRK